MEPAADLQAAEEGRHPSENRRPDGHSAQEAQDEAGADRPVHGSGGEVVPDDAIPDHDVLRVACDSNGRVRMADTGWRNDFSHVQPPARGGLSTWGFFWPMVRK